MYSFDNNEWSVSLQNKSTLELYRNHKKQIDEEKWFKNGNKYSIMMKCRSDTLSLYWRNRTNELEKLCPL